jgi:succinoglycan biosynthesis protein ExoL
MDLSSDGPNAVWLLPNRIYEGGLHAVVPIARAGTETGRWLAARELGLLVDDPVTDTVAALSALTAAAYQRLKARTLALDISDVVADLSDCRALVAALGEAAP